jgi:hypothetical protein
VKNNKSILRGQFMNNFDIFMAISTSTLFITALACLAIQGIKEYYRQLKSHQ